MRNAVDAAAGGELESFSLVELAVSRLRREILSGDVDPGERLVEEQLTRRLGISRAPLREALRLLAQQGLVEHVPRRGVRVATLSDADVAELYAVRDVLERHAVTMAFPLERPVERSGERSFERSGERSAAERSVERSGERSAADLDGLRAALARMRSAAELNDRLEVANAHRRFHVAVVALSGNRQLTLVYESILVKIQLYMAINLRREAELAQPLDGVHRHERLFQAVVAGDHVATLDELGRHGATSYLS